jgi:hypothetical protein
MIGMRLRAEIGMRRAANTPPDHACGAMADNANVHSGAGWSLCSCSRTATLGADVEPPIAGGVRPVFVAV